MMPMSTKRCRRGSRPPWPRRRRRASTERKRVLEKLAEDETDVRIKARDGDGNGGGSENPSGAVELDDVV